ncbi:unnamed protein product, partial [Symbiodinium sp. CCMP2456]
VDPDGQADFIRGFTADPGGRFAATAREFQSLMAGDEGGQDNANFVQLAGFRCIQWLPAQDILLACGAEESTDALHSLLEEKSSPYLSASAMLHGAAFRPLYISFLPGDVCTMPSAPTTPMSLGPTPRSSASNAGPFCCEVPSESQLDYLDRALQNLPGRHVHTMAVGFPVLHGYEGPGLPEVLLSSFIAVLEGGMDESGRLEHLENGQSFVEALLAVLTGRLVPCRRGQLTELDMALGGELEPGCSLTELVAADAEGSGNLINKICSHIQTKPFSCNEARAWWARHCRRAMECHPLLQGRAYRRTLLQNCVSTDSLSIASFPLVAGDLINNECANALADVGGLRVRVVSEAPTEMKPGDGENTEVDTLDWCDQNNQQRLRDLRKLMRCLFQAFELDETIKTKDCLSLTSHKRGRYGRWVCLNLTNVMVHSDIFAITFAVLTMYTLFAPDILLVFGLSTEHTQSLAIANTFVLFFFCVEAILSCIFMNGYMRSGRVFLDVMAMVSLAGDTLLLTYLFPEDLSAMAMNVVPSDHFTSSSSRILEILKFARLFRIVQLLRTLHGIVWRNFLRPHHGLAQQLYHKRPGNCGKSHVSL